VGYVDQLIYTGVGDRVDLTVEARGIGKFLDAVSMQLIALTGKTVAQLAQSICAQANVALDTLPGTAQFAQTVPCFVITPGETWASALNRLSAVYGFEVTATPDPALRITEKGSSDPAAYTYSGDHLAVAWGPVSDTSNLIRVIGSTGTTSVVFAEVVDATGIASSGVVRYRHVVERMLDTSARCAIKAGLLLRDEQAASARGTLTVQINPQHEVLDVITITDSRAGMNNQSARIHAIDTVIDWADGRWVQHLQLQKP
jgi:prophage tail gpP-like protein